MNLVMPLRFPALAVTGDLARAIFEASDQLLAGLSNVGTVHFARFVVVDGNLCMFSEYDGDFSAYIRDFIAKPRQHARRGHGLREGPAPHTRWRSTPRSSWSG